MSPKSSKIPCKFPGVHPQIETRSAAKQKWSQDKAKWNACNQDTKDQKLSGRKSWSYLYDCMTKA